MAKTKKRQPVCPECNGLGTTCLDCDEQCSYCLGTGYDYDDDSFEAIYRYEDWK